MPKIYKEDLQLDSLDPASFGFPKDGVSLFSNLMSDGLYMRKATDDKNYKIATEDEVLRMIEDNAPTPVAGDGISVDEETGEIGLEKTFYDYLRKMTFVAPTIANFRLLDGTSDVSGQFSGTKEYGFSLDFQEFGIRHRETSSSLIDSIKVEVKRGGQVLQEIENIEPSESDADVKGSPLVIETSESNGESYSVTMTATYRDTENITRNLTKSFSFSTKAKMFYGKAPAELSDISAFASGFDLSTLTYTGATTGQYLWLCYEAGVDPVNSSFKLVNQATNIEVPLFNVGSPVIVKYTNVYGVEMTYNCYRSASVVNDASITVLIRR